MATRGRKPKPTAMKELEGNPGKHPLNTSEPKPNKKAPACPKWLEPEAKKEWRRLAKQMEAIGILTEVDNEAIQQQSIAQQNADKQKIENEAAIAKAEADKQVAITNAEAEAQKTSIAADAQAEANRKLAESLSDTLIDYQKIQKWDGKLPTVSGGNALVSIDPAE